MSRWCVSLIALFAACRDDEPIERLQLPVEPPPAPPWATAPPPPPPPPVPQHVEPPAEIASFLAAGARATGPWRVTIHALTDDASRGRRFLGYRITGTRAVAQPRADELIARLARATSYVDGDVGCVGQPVGIAIARGDVALDLVEDCHHVYLTAQGHDGRWALFSSEMAAFVDGLRGDL